MRRPQVNIAPTAEELELIRRASAKLGYPPSTFVRQAAVAAAERVDRERGGFAGLALLPAETKERRVRLAPARRVLEIKGAPRG